MIRGALETLNQSGRGAPKRTKAQKAQIAREKAALGPCGRPCGGCEQKESCND